LAELVKLWESECKEQFLHCGLMEPESLVLYGGTG